MANGITPFTPLRTKFSCYLYLLTPPKGAPQAAAGRGIGSTDIGPDWWQREWFNRIKDLVDQYQPDLLYSDGRLPFESYGLSVVANLYNLSAQKHGGRVEAIYNSKLNTDCETGTCVLDLERTI